MSYHLTRRTIGLFLITSFVPIGAWAQRSGSTIPNARIYDAIGVREGITVCEIGAGDGALSIEAGRLVGPGGRVYTSELGEDRLKTLQSRVTASGLSHVTVVEGGPVRTNFPDGACDAMFMRNVYHHFADPAAMNPSLAAALKPGGRLAIVDFTPPKDEATRPADRAKDGMHGVSPESVSREMAAAGFEPVSSAPGTEHWFMVVVSKPAR